MKHLPSDLLDHVFFCSASYLPLLALPSVIGTRRIMIVLLSRGEVCRHRTIAVIPEVSNSDPFSALALDLGAFFSDLYSSALVPSSHSTESGCSKGKCLMPRAGGGANLLVERVA